MEIKVKPIDRRNWGRVTKKKIAFEKINETGIVCLLQIQELKEPLIKTCFGRNVKLADIGYYWLQIAFQDDNYWLTAMFDEKGKFIQYYFDVTRINVINGVDSYFEDLFLDVIVIGDNEVDVLDSDELEKALREKVISKSEFNLAKKVAEDLCDNLLKNREEFDKLSKNYFEKLRNNLK